MTNQPYPIGSYRDEPRYKHLTEIEILENCRLTYRWQYLSNGDKEGCLLTLQEAEIDAWYRSPRSDLKSSFRGPSTKGGSCLIWLAGELDFDKAERTRCKDIDLFSLRHPTDYLQGSGKRYTFADGFCGAGGTSRGAKAADLRVDWSFDSNKQAIDTYRLNFYETKCWCFARQIPF